MQTKRLARSLVTTAFITATAMGSASGIAAADTPHPTNTPAGISQSVEPTFNFNKVSDSEGIVTLKGAKFVTDGTHTSIVDNHGKTLEVLPAKIAQDGKVTTFTYTLNGDHKATVHSSVNDNQQVNEYKEWWKCVAGTAGGAIVSGIGGAAVGGATGSAIPGAGTAAGAAVAGIAGAIGGGAAGAAASC